jgi:hypothetical protein
MSIIQSSYSVFNSLAEAEAVAEANQIADPYWSYIAVADPEGSERAVIKIIDEDNCWIGNV